MLKCSLFPPKLSSSSALLDFFPQISFLQALDKVHFIPLYLRHAHVHVSNSGLIGVTSLAETWLSRVLSIQNMHFLPHPFSTSWPNLSPPSFVEGAGGCTSLHAQELYCLLLGNLSLCPSFSEKSIHMLCICMGYFSPLLGPFTFHSLWCSIFTCCFGFVDGSGKESLYGQAEREKVKKRKTTQKWKNKRISILEEGI